MEDEKRINWLSLLIKVIIIFVFALILIWLISKIVGKKELSETFKSNLNNMEKVSVEYFKTVDLPQKKGEYLKITLGEMIEKKLIISEKDKTAKSCDSKNSFAKITRENKNYVVEVTLKCGKEEDTVTSKFSFDDCKNCSKDNDKKDNNSNKENSSNSTENKNDENVTNNGKVTYYEYVKETTNYSKWMRGSKTGNNIENKYEYYSIENDNYYSLGYIKKGDLSNDKVFKYTIKLNSVPNEKYYFTTVQSSNYFDKSEVKNYLNKSNTSIYNKSNISNVDENSILKASLSNDNFDYKLLPYHRNGAFYVDVKVRIKSMSNIDYYYSKDLKSDIVFIPLKFNIKFASNEIVTDKPNGEYDTISYYRYVETSRDVIWSTESYVEGYTKTGKTK